MSSYGMISRDHRQWKIIATTSLTELARRLGALDDFSQQVTRHRQQRAVWHAWLDRYNNPELTEPEIHNDEAHRSPIGSPATTAVGCVRVPMTAPQTFCTRNPVVAATKARAVAPQKQLCVVFSQRCCRSSFQ